MLFPLAILVVLIIVIYYFARVERFDSEMVKAAVHRTVLIGGDFMSFKEDIGMPHLRPLAFVKLINAYKNQELTNEFIARTLAE